jgi:hypothetical protein
LKKPLVSGFSLMKISINVSDTFFMGRDLGRQDHGYGFVIFQDGFFIGNGMFLDNTFVQKQLLVSDLILEKDLIPILK